MSTIASCPRCTRQVSIPPGADSAEMVRCPLCAAEYPLAEALATAPPVLVLVSSLSAENLPLAEPGHQPAAAGDSGLDLFAGPEHGQGADVAAMSGLGLNKIEYSPPPLPMGDDELGPLSTEPASLESHLEEHSIGLEHGAGQAFGDLPGEQGGAQETNGAAHPSEELQFNELPGADAGHEGLAPAEGSDFAKSFDQAEPAVGNAADLPETGNFGGAASDWLVEEPPVEDAGDLELPGDEPAGEAMFGESGEDDTVDLGSEFEEAQAEMADAGDDYSLEQEPVGAATDAEAATPPDEKPAKAKKAKRKPSMVTNIIMYLLGLLIALPFAYAALFFGVKMDPINLAGFLPAWIVPAELKTKTTPINVARVTPPNPTPDLPGAGVADAGVMGDDSTDDAAAEDQGAEDKAAGAEMPSDDDTAAAGDSATGESATDDDADDKAADSAAGGLPGDDTAAMPDEADAAGDANTADVGADAPEAAMPEEDATADLPPEDMPAEDDAAAAADTDSDTATLPESSPEDMPAEDDATPDESAAGDDSDTKDSAATEEMPAEEKPAEGAAATDDAAATTGDDKPAGKEKPAKPETSGPQVGPRDGVQYTPADIDRSLAELAAASEALDSAPKADAKKFKGQFYRKLYQLAEVATFTPSMVASPQAQQGSQQEVVYHALTGSTATPTKFAEVGKAAAIWLSAIKGKEHQGIVLSGTVQRISHRGKVFETEILLTDNEHVVTVLSPTAPPMGHRDAAVVWGSIVDDPAKKIAGYPGGTAEVVVWATTVEPAPAGAVGTRKAAALPKQER